MKKKKKEEEKKRRRRRGGGGGKESRCLTSTETIRLIRDGKEEATVIVTYSHLVIGS